MKSFYALTRQVHLFAGLILALAILFYTFSGIVFVYGKWIPRETTRDSTQQIAVPSTASVSGAALRAFVVTTVAAEGRTDGFKPTPDGGFQQRWTWMSGGATAKVAADRSTLSVTRSRYGPLRILRNFHVLRGARGGIGYLAWWVLLDVVSLAMLLFAVTGFLLWYRSTKDRRLGWVIFGGSWCYTLGLIAHLAWS